MTLFLVKLETLFIPATEILGGIAQQDDPPAGTGRLLMAAMERLKEPELANPPSPSGLKPEAIPEEPNP